MMQAWELFTRFSARKASEAEKPPTIEAQHVEVLPPRAEPLSFLTLETVEGIVRNTDIEDLEEHETWERRMEKFVNLGDATHLRTLIQERDVTWWMGHCTRTFFLPWQQGNKTSDHCLVTSTIFQCNANDVTVSFIDI